MKTVFVVLWAGAPRVFDSEAQAMEWGEANAAREIHECPVEGAKPRLQVIRPNGHAIQARPNPSRSLGPDEVLRGPDGSEYIHQPHRPIPETRRAPDAPVPVCNICRGPLRADGYCNNPICPSNGQAIQAIQTGMEPTAEEQAVRSLPRNLIPPPVPGAEHM